MLLNMVLRTKRTEPKAESDQPKRIKPIPGHPVVRRPGALVSLGEIIHSGKPYSLYVGDHKITQIHIGDDDVLR